MVKGQTGHLYDSSYTTVTSPRDVSAHTDHVRLREACCLHFQELQAESFPGGLICCLFGGQIYRVLSDRSKPFAPCTLIPSISPNDYLRFSEFIRVAMFNKMIQILVHNLQHLYILLCVYFLKSSLHFHHSSPLCPPPPLSFPFPQQAAKCFCVYESFSLFLLNLIPFHASLSTKPFLTVVNLLSTCHITFYHWEASVSHARGGLERRVNSEALTCFMFFL